MTNFEVKAMNQNDNPNAVRFGTSTMPEITAADLAKARRQNHTLVKRVAKAMSKVANAFEIGEGIPSIESINSTKVEILGTKVAAALKVAATYKV